MVHLFQIYTRQVWSTTYVIERPPRLGSSWTEGAQHEGNLCSPFFNQRNEFSMLGALCADVYVRVKKQNTLLYEVWSVSLWYEPMLGIRASPQTLVICQNMARNLESRLRCSLEGEGDPEVTLRRVCVCVCVSQRMGMWASSLCCLSLSPGAPSVFQILLLLM